MIPGKSYVTGVLSFFLLLLAALPSVASPEVERGFPLVQSYLPEDYSSDSQNTSVVQDSNGLIFVANINGVLEFDGVRWELYRHPDNLQPFSLCVDEQNRIFVGFDHDIGILVSLPDGRRELRSLTPFLPDSIQPVSVWTTVATPEGIVFEDWYHMLRWIPSNELGDEGEFIVHSFPESNPYSAYIHANDAHYVTQFKIGLLTLRNDSLVMVPGGEFFKDHFVFEMSAFGPETLLLATLDDNDNETWFTFSKGVAKRFNAPITKYSSAKNGIELMPIREGLFALATESGGLALFNRLGEIEAIHDRTTGLPDNVVHTGTLDREGGLWLPLDHGVARLQINAPTTRFGYNQGLFGTVMSIARFQGSLVVGTDQGVSVLQPAHGAQEEARLKRLPHMTEWTWELLTARNRLLVAVHDAIYEIRDLTSKHPPRKVNAVGGETLFLSADSNYVLYGGGSDGLGYFQWNGTQWMDRGIIEGTEGKVGNIAQGAGGEYWLTVGDRFLERVQLTSNRKGELLLESRVRFGEEHGLPGVDFYYPFLLHGRIYVGSYYGLFRFDRETGQFDPDTSLFDTGFRTLSAITAPIVDHQGRIWFDSEPWSGLVATPQPYGKYLISAPLNQGRNRSFYAIYPELDGVVWAGGPGGTLIRYDENLAQRDTSSFQAILRKVVARGDSLQTILPHAQRSDPVVLPWRLNSLRFEYAIPRFNRSSHNEYQYRLVGLTNIWSDWSREAYHDFENLREGRYRFEVRGRDADSHVSEVAVLELRILPPLHRTAVAYGIYMLLLAGGFIGYQRIRSIHIRKVNRQLEQLVKVRTRSLEESLTTLKHEVAERERAQKERSTYQEQFQHAQRMESVGRLASGLAHDFNNLLSVIHGHASVALTDKSMSGHLRTQLTLIMGTSERAAHLIRELLTYTRHKAIKTSIVHLGKLVEQLSPMVERLLVPRVELKIDYTTNLWKTEVDPRQVEQAILNLAINARDAMPHGGQFTLSITNFTANEAFCRLHHKVKAEDYVLLRATDTGVGIPEELRTKVFEPFFTTKADGAGTGLGLASVYTAVDQIGGVTWVESEVNKGTTINLLFPRAIEA